MNRLQHAVPWWQSAVIYHLYVRSFKDSNGDGNGDLAGVLHQLDYLSETLRVDALWLSPVYPSPMVDAGYDVTDHTGIDPLFGDLSLFDQLLVEAHRRHLRVILDFIPNHTSDQHPWFLASCSDRQHPQRDWYDRADPHHPRLMIGEVSLFEWQQWATYYGVALDEFHMPFNFGLLGAIHTARNVRQVVDTVEAVLPAGAWPCYVLGNHDESRIATRVGKAQARVAMMLLLTLRGTPMVYYGDEIGMHDVHIPASRVQDPWELRVPGKGFGRDPERTPMQWDKSFHAGFCEADAWPWLPLAEDAQECNVAAQLADPHSMLSLTRRLMHLRRTSTALIIGRHRSFPQAPDGCLVYERSEQRERWLIALNFTDEEHLICLPEASGGRIVLSTLLDREEAVALSALLLRAHEGCLIAMETEGRLSHVS